MKKSEIEVGAVYSNGKGRTRWILKRGDVPGLYNEQKDTDCVMYQDNTGRIGTMTAARFANWAKEKVEYETEG